MSAPQPGVGIRELWPLLFVRDIEASLAFYRDRLGFELVGEAREAERLYWCRIKRGGASLMLQQAESDEVLPARRSAIVIYIVCDDAAALHSEFGSRGLTLAAPMLASYGMLQLFVPEPDGYPLCFESPT